MHQWSETYYRYQVIEKSYLNKNKPIKLYIYQYVYVTHVHSANVSRTLSHWHCPVELEPRFFNYHPENWILAHISARKNVSKGSANRTAMPLSILFTVSDGHTISANCKCFIYSVCNLTSVYVTVQWTSCKKALRSGYHRNKHFNKDL